MKSVQDFLEELADAVRPSAGQTITLLEKEPGPNHDFNWIIGGSVDYQSAIVDLRNQNARLDWEDVTERNGKWRCINTVKKNPPA